MSEINNSYLVKSVLIEKWGVFFKKLLMTKKWLIRKGHPLWFMVDWNLKESAINLEVQFAFKNSKIIGFFTKLCEEIFSKKLL